MKIGFDFDGTLAVCPHDHIMDFDDPAGSLSASAAVIGGIRWLRQLFRQGHDVVVITGRGAIHQGSIRYWLFVFTGRFIDVVTRPTAVGIGIGAQAAWKAEVIQSMGVDIYVGDNLDIDARAAQMASIGFIDAAQLRRGEMPPLPGASNRRPYSTAIQQ